MSLLSIVPGPSRGRSALRSVASSASKLLIGGVLVATATACGGGTESQARSALPAETASPDRTGSALPTPSSNPVPSDAAAAPDAAKAGPSPSAVAATKTTKPTGTAPSPTRTTATLKAAAAPVPATTLPRFQPNVGTYPLRIAGTSAVNGKAATVPSTGSLVVEARGQDQQHRTIGVPGGLVIVQRANAVGTDLVSLSITAASRTLTFVPTTPMAYVRTGLGQTWAGSARSTDGSVSLSEAGEVTGTGSVTVGGQAIPVTNIRQVFTVSGVVQGTVVLTSSISTVDRLPLVQRQVIDAKATFLVLFSTRIVSDTTTTLTTTRPS